MSGEGSSDEGIIWYYLVGPSAITRGLIKVKEIRSYPEENRGCSDVAVSPRKPDISRNWNR